jgi:hypothetical protein
VYGIFSNAVKETFENTIYISPAVHNRQIPGKMQFPDAAAKGRRKIKTLTLWLKHFLEKRRNA